MGGEDGIGIQALVAGRGEAAAPQVRPELGRSVHDWCREGVVDQSERQGVQSHPPRASTSSDQLAANLVVGDLGDDHDVASQFDRSEPELTSVAARMAGRAAE
jgi:hypothetical protein